MDQVVLILERQIPQHEDLGAKSHVFDGLQSQFRGAA